MKEVVFLLGPDRCGKSTLADKFIKAGYEYRHFEPPKKSPYLEYLEFFRELKDSKIEKWIVDRYVWCEYAYSRHYNRYSDCTVPRVRALETKFLDFDSKIVYCETDLKSNWARIVKEGKKEFKSVDELVFLREWYHEILKDSVLPSCTYDFTKGDTFENLFNIKTV